MEVRDLESLGSDLSQLPFMTSDLSPANPADVGPAAAAAAGDGHVVSLCRSRDPLHAAAGPRREIGYRSVDVAELRRSCI